jgi:hypothetical protein
LNVKSEENISIGNEKVIEDKEEEIVKISGKHNNEIFY